MASLLRLRVQVATMMGRGEPWERVEEEVIDPSGLDSDQKAALWLYGWSFLGQQEQRAEAERYLAVVGDGSLGGKDRRRVSPDAARTRRRPARPPRQSCDRT